MDTLTFAIIAAGVVAFALVSRRIENTVLTAPMVFAAFGLALGDGGLGVIQLNATHGFIHGLAEVTLLLVLFSDAARIRLKTLRRDHNLPVRMLVIGMPLTVATGTAVALYLPLGFSIWEAALLAALLTPTDAALGQAVISNPRVPMRIRQTVNVESGLNDGIALPIVLLFASIAGAGAGSATLGGPDWLLLFAGQVILGPLAGVVIGGAGAWAVDRSAKRKWISGALEGAAVLGVAILAYSGAELIGGNGFIAAFVAGLVFGNVVRGRCGFVFEFAEAEGQLLVLLAFLIFGATLLPEALPVISWWTVLYAVLSLTLIRMVPIALSLIGAGVRPATVLVLGWFGPRGLATILFALLIIEKIGMEAGDELLGIAFITVGLSILAHGITAAPFARAYARMTRHPHMSASEELKDVTEMPIRAFGRALRAFPGNGKDSEK